MAKNKEHWYDGWFYDKFIAPNQDKLFGQINNIINPDSRIIDIGCGTGRLSFTLLNKCNRILGIDLSEKNIERANLTLSKNPDSKISFTHKSLSEIISDGKEHFDYAVMTYVIHEVDESERVNLLEEMAQVANKIIIGDYFSLTGNGFINTINIIVEFLAGKDHYRNFKTYIRNGGINGIINKTNFKVLQELKNSPKTSHLILLQK
ncbi:MAG TPA: class I SAM-dependent methyltransferase [Ignavibacteria bacterium]